MKAHYQNRRALGCAVALNLVTAAPDATVADIFKQLWLEILLFEKRCSRFLPSSELSQFNRAAGVRRHISGEFRDALLAASRMAGSTAGLFNPFILPALQRSGYVGSLEPGKGQDHVDDHSAKKVVSPDRLEIGDDWARIPYGTALDLGGCGKGYIGDRLADMVDRISEVRGYWFSIGGDTVLNGHDQDGEAWAVYLQPDPRSASTIGEVQVPLNKRRAVATSTTKLRTGRTDGRAWHHIIDPRSGSPAHTDITLATTYADSLLECDVMASSLVVIGSTQASALLNGSGIKGAYWQGASTGQLWGEGIKTYVKTVEE